MKQYSRDERRELATMHYTLYITKNRDYVYNLLIDEHSSVEVVHVHNGNSGTYMGFSVDAFTDSLRSLLRQFPDILEDIEHMKGGTEKALAKHGFIKREMTDMELILTDFKHDTPKDLRKQQ